MSPRKLDLWLASQPIAKKLNSLIGLTLFLLATVIVMQVLGAVGTYKTFQGSKDLHARAVASLSLEKDLASLERDVFKAVADPTPARFSAADGNMADFHQSIEAADRMAVGQEHHGLVHQIRNGAAEYDRLLADLKRSLKGGQLQQTTATAARLSRIGGELDDEIEQIRDGLKADSAAQDAFLLRTISLQIIAVLIIGLLAAVAGRLLGRRVAASVSDPLKRTSHLLERLAAHDYGLEIEGADRGDELGALARAAIALRETGLEKAQLEQREATARQSRERAEREAAEYAEVRRRSALAATADSFETNVMQVVNTVATVAGQIDSGSRETNAAAERSRGLSASVATAAGQASHNVQAMAVATREMSQSISEVAQQVSQSSAIAQKAVAKAHDTDEIVTGLSASAQRIGEVIGLIQSVAGQTNLLALNATIEAARAGVAGRGFAVVASEIKNLAAQTADATAAITDQIVSMQSVSAEAVDAIAHIRGINVELNDILSSVAAAVEEQAMTTQQISRNTQDVAAGTDDVARNIAAVREGVEATGNAARDGLEASSELSRQAQALKTEVERFLANVRAA